MRNKLTVSTIISAYNEEKNIKNFLNSLVQQEETNFKFEEIVVVSDGSEDDTVGEAKKISDPRVKIYEEKQRMGKAKRLNDYFASCESDALLIFDADTLLDSNSTVAKLLAPLSKISRVGMIGGNAKILPGRTFIEKAINSSAEVFYEIREKYKGGNNAFGTNGCILALAKDFYKRVRLAENMLGDDHFLYFSCLKMGLKFVYQKDAIIWYRAPSTIKDHIKQNKRFISNSLLMRNVFGDLAEREYRVPRALMLRLKAKAILKDPVHSIAIYLINIYCRRAARNEADRLNGKWDIASSTKENINIEARRERAGFSFYLVLRNLVYKFIEILGVLIPKKPHIVVFAHHSIASDGWRFSVKKEEFEQQINHLLKTHIPIKASELPAYISGAKKPEKNMFVLAFDDGYENIIKVKDFLKEKGITPVFFLIADNAQADRMELANNLSFLKTEEVESLLEAGWEVGSHSKTHADFSKLSDSKLIDEISESKKILENKLGVPVRYFAYPKGMYGTRIREAVRDAGYDLGFSMDNGYVVEGIDRFAIPRVGVDGTHRLNQFKVIYFPVAMMMRKIIWKSLSLLKT